MGTKPAGDAKLAHDSLLKIQSLEMQSLGMQSSGMQSLSMQP